MSVLDYPDPQAVEIRALTAERDRAQRDCQRLSEKNMALRAALLRISSIIETQSEPDIDAMHDACREALNK